MSRSFGKVLHEIMVYAFPWGEHNPHEVVLMLGELLEPYLDLCARLDYDTMEITLSVVLDSAFCGKALNESVQHYCILRFKQR